MSKIWQWLKYLLPIFILVMLRRRARADEIVAHFLDSKELAKSAQFKIDAARPDWGDEDYMSAKLHIEDRFMSNKIKDLVALPQFYYSLLDDVSLKEFGEAISIIDEKLKLEAGRRAGN